MTEQIQTLESSLCNVGTYIQDNVQKGYRLVEGYPLSYGWQYEIIMERIEKPIVPQEAVEVAAQRKPGRPVKDK